jgi:septal ring factor EnvC (AmiA/AmiB activator)
MIETFFKSDKEVENIMLAYESMIKSDPLFAKNFLLRTGILNEQDELSNDFKQKLRDYDVDATVRQVEALCLIIPSTQDEISALTSNIQKTKDQIDILLRYVKEDSAKIDSLKEDIHNAKNDLVKALRIKDVSRNMHIAKDSSGQWWAFDMKPYITRTGWDYECNRPEKLWLKESPEDWQNSLFGL